MPTIDSSGESSPPITSFAELVATYTADPDAPPQTETISLAAALVAGDDPWGVIGYLAGIGIFVKELADFIAINADETEEELHAWPCQDGMAISIASEDVWLLFTP